MTSENTKNEAYMRRAIQLAEKAVGYTSPNPMVGCVVVKDGKIISEGYHEHIGGFHAERNALLACTTDTEGAELYVTLEPCCHYGKTPPCTEIIIEKKIKKVYVGAMDSNPLVAGKGVAILREAGIEVETGVLEQECRRQNEVFFHYMETKLPFVAMKYAMTLDGKIACANGDSKWVTNECSRQYVQQLRKRYQGIMVGIETVVKDDPALTCRVAMDCSPTRIVCDSHLRIPIDCQLVRTAAEVPVIVAFADDEKEDEKSRKQLQEKQKQLEQKGVICLKTTEVSGKVNVTQLIQMLAARGIDGILLEGGATLIDSMLKAQLVDRVYAFISPKIVGSKDAKSPVEGNGVTFMKDAVQLQDTEIKNFEEDIMITGRVCKNTCLQD